MSIQGWARKTGSKRILKVLYRNAPPPPTFFSPLVIAYFVENGVILIQLNVYYNPCALSHLLASFYVLLQTRINGNSNNVNGISRPPPAYRFAVSFEEWAHREIEGEGGRRWWWLWWLYISSSAVCTAHWILQKPQTENPANAIAICNKWKSFCFAALQWHFIITFYTTR